MANTSHPEALPGEARGACGRMTPRPGGLGYGGGSSAPFTALQPREHEALPEVVGDHPSIALDAVLAEVAADVLDVAGQQVTGRGVETGVGRLGKVDDLDVALV